MELKKSCPFCEKLFNYTEIKKHIGVKHLNLDIKNFETEPLKCEIKFDVRNRGGSSSNFPSIESSRVSPFEFRVESSNENTRKSNSSIRSRVSSNNSSN